MRYLKRGDPCPLCGQPIQTDSYEELELLSCIAWVKEYLSIVDLGECSYARGICSGGPGGEEDADP